MTKLREPKPVKSTKAKKGPPEKRTRWIADWQKLAAMKFRPVKINDQATGQDWLEYWRECYPINQFAKFVMQQSDTSLTAMIDDADAFDTFNKMMEAMKVLREHHAASAECIQTAQARLAVAMARAAMNLDAAGVKPNPICCTTDA